MTRDDLRASRDFSDRGRNVALVAFDVAAAVEIDVRKHPVEEVIAHVNHIRASEEDYAVAVRVSVREVDDANLLTVEVDR